MIEKENKIDYTKNKKNVNDLYQYTNKLKIYLDTSVISYLQQEDAPEKMRDTLDLWSKIEKMSFRFLYPKLL